MFIWGLFDPKGDKSGELVLVVKLLYLETGAVFQGDASAIPHLWGMSRLLPRAAWATAQHAGLGFAKDEWWDAERGAQPVTASWLLGECIFPWATVVIVREEEVTTAIAGESLSERVWMEGRSWLLQVFQADCWLPQGRELLQPWCVPRAASARRNWWDGAVGCTCAGALTPGARVSRIPTYTRQASLRGRFLFKVWKYHDFFIEVFWGKCYPLFLPVLCFVNPYENACLLLP